MRMAPSKAIEMVRKRRLLRNFIDIGTDVKAGNHRPPFMTDAAKYCTVDVFQAAA